MRQSKVTSQYARTKLFENYGDSIELLSQCNRSHDMIQLKCKICGFVWTANANHYIRNKGYVKNPCCMCRQKACSYEAQCKNCGVKFKKYIKQHSAQSNDFCSRSCAASYNNRGVVRNASQKNRHVFDDKGRVIIRACCIACGKELVNAQRKYCSVACQRKYQYESYIQKWLSGEDDGVIGECQISKMIRSYLIDLADNRCQQCGWSVVNSHTGTVPLQIHHIDGNYKNNRPQNLKVLCPCCHSLTPTFRGLNRGNGRCGRQ